MFRQALAGIIIAAFLVLGTLSLPASKVNTPNGKHLTVAEMAQITGAGRRHTTAVLIGSLAFSFGLTAAVVGVAVLSGGVAAPAAAAIYIGYVSGGVTTAAAGWSAIWCGAGKC